GGACGWQGLRGGAGGGPPTVTRERISDGVVVHRHPPDRGGYSLPDPDRLASLAGRLGCPELDQPDDLQLLGSGASHAPSSPAPSVLFLSSRFSSTSSATANHLLQRTGLPAQIIDLVRGRRPRGVPGQALLAG